MAIDVTFDEEKRLLRVTISGAWPTLPEIVAERSRLILAGIIRPGVVELVDARQVTKGIPNLSQMQAILHSISKPASQARDHRQLERAIRRRAHCRNARSEGPQGVSR